MPERIFIVGHGAATCLGPDMDTTWKRLIAGESGIRRHEALGPESFLQDVAGLVQGLAPDGGTGNRTLVKLSARFLSLAMTAAREAWADSGMDRKADAIEPGRAAVMVGSAFG